MGLDNIIYERRGVKDKDLSEALAPLTGGMLVDGNNSFRGKVYAGWFENITSYSLYESDDFSDQDYKNIIDELKSYKTSFKYIDDLDEDLENSNMNAEELDAFIKLFQLCEERSWGINAWY